MKKVILKSTKRSADIPKKLAVSYAERLNNYFQSTQGAATRP